jgi:hypothetical protein
MDLPAPDVKAKTDCEDILDKFFGASRFTRGRGIFNSFNIC